MLSFSFQKSTANPDLASTQETSQFSVLFWWGLGQYQIFVLTLAMLSHYRYHLHYLYDITYIIQHVLHTDSRNIIISE